MPRENGETLKKDPKIHLYNRILHIYSRLGLGRSTWRLAAEDGNVHIHALPFAEYTTGDFTWLLFLSDTVKRLSVNATRMRLSVFGGVGWWWGVFRTPRSSDKSFLI